MSQVIVTDDVLNAKRESTKRQENQIDTGSVSKKWHLSDVATHGVGARKIILLALSPIFAVWGLLILGVSFAMGLFSYAMRIIGKIVPR